MRLAPALVMVFSAAAFAVPAVAKAAEITLGVAAPLTQTAELLGAQLRDGAKAAAAASEHQVSLEIADDRCSAEGGAEAARRFVERQVQAVVGFLCTEAIEAALPVLSPAGIPVVTPGVRTDSLTDTKDKTGWLVFRTAPRADAEEEAVAKILTERWRDALFAIVDDGTIYGRELAENLRAAAEMAGLKPVFVDTFRPQMDNQIGLLGRLRNAGATHVFVGGDRSDIAIIARDAKELEYDLTIAGGEALRAESAGVLLAPGVLMIGLPRWADMASDEALEALEKAAVQPEGYVLPAFAAVQVAVGAAVKASASGRPIAEALAGGSFDTALGPIRFDARGDRADNPYRLFRFDGREFVELD